MGCCDVSKRKFLHSPQIFPANLFVGSNYQGKQFHQDIQTIEGRYKGGFRNEGIIGDYC